jgi:hypothetical protein
LESLVCLIDEGLFQYDAIWAAAGTPRAVFRLTPADLQRITGGPSGFCQGSEIAAPNESLHRTTAACPEEAGGLRLPQQQVHHPATPDVFPVGTTVAQNVLI